MVLKLIAYGKFIFNETREQRWHDFKEKICKFYLSFHTDDTGQQLIFETLQGNVEIDKNSAGKEFWCEDRIRMLRCQEELEVGVHTGFKVPDINLKVFFQSLSKGKPTWRVFPTFV